MTTPRPTPPEPSVHERPPAATYPPAPAAPPRSNPFEKTPLLAALFSVVPGLGNVYNGLYLRGLAFSALCFGLFMIGVLREEEALIPAIIFFWLFNIIDAYRQATFINYGYNEARAEPPAFPEERSGSGGLVLGVAIFLVGVYGLLTHIFPEFDLEEVFQFWYVAFLGLGGWLIYHTVLKDRQEDGDREPSYGEISAEEPRPDETEEAA